METLPLFSWKVKQVGQETQEQEQQKQKQMIRSVRTLAVNILPNDKKKRKGDEKKYNKMNKPMTAPTKSGGQKGNFPFLCIQKFWHTFKNIS